MISPIDRRERSIRLYYLHAVCDRMRRVGGDDMDLPAAFGVSTATFASWIQKQREPIPRWIVELAIRAYRIPPPPPASSSALLWILLGVVLVGVGLMLALPRLLR